jgi:hypothetical protein
MKNQFMVGFAAVTALANLAGPANAEQLQSQNLLQQARIAQASSSSQQPAAVVRMPKKALEKVRWFNAPRQIDLIDDRPIVHDHRTGPEAAQLFDIPIAPLPTAVAQGTAGDNASIPSGGIPVPGNALPYRTSSPLLAGLPTLPKVGFDSNIPAYGLARKMNLPSGTTTNRLCGKMMPHPNPAAALSRPGHLLAHAPVSKSAPAVWVYPRPTGNGSASGGAATSATVHAELKRGALLSGK